jgi:hypothetical protein
VTAHAAGQLGPIAEVNDRLCSELLISQIKRLMTSKDYEAVAVVLQVAESYFDRDKSALDLDDIKVLKTLLKAHDRVETRKNVLALREKREEGRARK